MNPVIRNQRLVFADFTKLFAMFAVTWGHCAQSLSGQTFPGLFGKPGILIAFHMPLFMMISGYFIHPESIRKKSCPAYILEKFQRLAVPAMAWYVCFCLLTIQKPHLTGLYGFYWFLTSLFISQMLISIIVKLNKGDHLLLYLCFVIIVVFLPFSSFLHVNFMFPLMMGGYIFRRATQQLNGGKLAVCTIALFVFSVILFYYWDVRHSVYITPFDSLHFSEESLHSLFLRLATGFVISSFFILLLMSADKLPMIQRLSQYGKYTLVMYTASFIFNKWTDIFLSHIHVRFTQAGLLEMSSCILCIMVCVLCVMLAKMLEKNKTTKRLLLGISRPSTISQ